MLICICDDEEKIRESIRKICAECTRDMPDIRIATANSGEDVLGFEGDIDILLLDIDMPRIDGIQVKDRLSDSDTTIIFITNHEERIREAFGLNVFAFVDKQKLDNDLPFFLKKAIETKLCFKMVEGEDGECCDSRWITKIDSEGNYVRVCYKDNSGDKHMLLRKKMKEIEQELSPYGFVRIDRNCIVNIERITDVGNSYVDIGEKLPISVRRRQEVKEAIREYNRNKMRYQ